MNTITGCWKGALISEDGREQPFSLSQPSHTAVDQFPELVVDGARARARLLDGTSRALVAFAEAPEERIARLLVEARVLGDRLVGEWLRRNADGQVVARGRLQAARA